MKTVGYLPKATKPKDNADKSAKPANGNGGKGGNKPANTDGNKPKDNADPATGRTADSGKDGGTK